jgi:hypothetical protein
MDLKNDPMKNSFPLWAYLNQKLFSLATPLILHPLKFWQHYQIFQLEQCWDFDAVQNLESSWNRELDSEASHVNPIKE